MAEPLFVTNFGVKPQYMAVISFSAADATFSWKNKTVLKTFIANIFTQEQKKVFNVTYVFCTDEYLLQINKDFLQHNYYTDIITFNLTERPNEPILGEIYISLERIKENSSTHQTSLQQETLRVIFHGVLHLCGYKDKTKKDIVLMREKEDYYINQFLSKT